MIRILIVDDEKIERNGIKFLLKQLHMEAQIREAVNGVKALEALEEEPADILLTDIKMPFMGRSYAGRERGGEVSTDEDGDLQWIWRV